MAVLFFFQVSRFALLLPFALIFLGACGHTLVVTSTPAPANVYFLDSKGSRVSLAGQTPLVMKSPKDGSKRYFLEIDKVGFVPRTILVDQAHIFGSTSKVSVSLTEQNRDWFSAAMVGAFAGETSMLVSEFIELRTRIEEQDDAKVKAMEKQMKAKYSDFSVFNATMGAYYFSVKNGALAKKYLLKAVELNPQDATSKRLLVLSQSSAK
jgi:hypothetical protein